MRQGTTPAGAPSPVDSLNAPFTNGAGKVGFIGALVNGDFFIWFDTGIVWLNSDSVAPVLNFGESTMGISDAGAFIYSPLVDGNDGLWTQAGLLLQATDAAPGIGGATAGSQNRPRMLPDGRIYWVGTFDDGGTDTGRALYTSSDGTLGNAVIVMKSDDMLGAVAIARPDGIGFSYDISDNNTYRLQTLKLATGGTGDDEALALDGALIAQEGQPTGDGDNWQNFDLVSVNNSGDYLFSGDTDALSSSDEFIAYNGTIVLREGDTVHGIVLTTSGNVQALSINDLGQAAFIWSYAGGQKTLFTAGDAANLALNSRALLSIGDRLDLDGNGTADATVANFKASSAGPGLDLAEDGRLFVALTHTTDGVTYYEDVVQLAFRVCGDGVIEAGEECDDSGETVSCDADCTAAACGDGALNVTAGEACDNGPANSDTAANACRTNCSPATCGDGVTDSGETCDDATANSNTQPDACRANCQWPTCGDGVADSSEECDDGAGNNNTAADACRSNCRSAWCGDGVTDAGEECDDATDNSDTAADACRATTCTAAACGDGVIDAGEECDDGYESPTCTASCLDVGVCGDSIVGPTEDCDDGAESATCDDDCTVAECGDGTPNATAGETCDDGNTDSGDGCSSTCKVEGTAKKKGCSAAGGAGAPAAIPLLLGLLFCGWRRRR